MIHAGFTSLLGITVPFGGYTAASSGLAFLLNPVVGLAILAGGFFILRGHTNKKTARRIVGMTLFQISVNEPPERRPALPAS